MTLHLLGSSGFGNELCALLGEAPEVLVQPLSAFHDPSRWPRAAIQVVIVDREEPSVFEVCDMVSRSLRRPWMPVVLEPRSVRIGPLVRPNSACYQCFLRRQEQLGHRTAVDEEMEQHGAIPRIAGYLPSHVDLAASLARRLIDMAKVDTPVVDMYRIGLAEVRITSAVVTPVDGCRRCTRLRSFRETGDIAWSLSDPRALQR